MYSTIKKLLDGQLGRKTTVNLLKFLEMFVKFRRVTARNTSQHLMQHDETSEFAELISGIPIKAGSETETEHFRKTDCTETETRL